MTPEFVLETLFHYSTERMIRDTFLPFCAPDISEEEIQAVGEVLRSGWITTGPKSAEFEEKFSEYVGAPGGVALTSATAGMHVVLKALGVGPGTEVLTPALTWVSTLNIITLLGAKPVFADVDRETLMVTPESVKSAITPATRVIIPVHYAGAACDLDPLREIANEHGAAFIEDAAHAIGTEYKGHRVGSSGTTIFSFHPIKNMTTGEGGMVCSHDPQLLDHIKRLKFHGLGIDAFDRQTQGRAPLAEVLEPGYKYNFTDIAAVLGLGQLARIESFNARRAELAHCYRELLSGIDEVRPLGLPSYEFKHSWHLFPVRLDIDNVKLSRTEFMEQLKARNIGTGIHFTAAHLHKYYREAFGCHPGMLPNTEYNGDRLVSLPFFPSMTFGDVEYVVESIKAVLAGEKL